MSLAEKKFRCARVGLLVTLLFIVIDGKVTLAQGPNEFEIFKREMMPHVGEKLTVVGVLSSGKLGWLVTFKNWFVYLYPVKRSDISKMKNLNRFDGRSLKVTGTLRYFPKPETVKSDVAVAVSPEHFYFDLAEITVSVVPPPGDVGAETKWPEFFASLRAAVKRRDRAALKQMMDREFFYSLGHHASDKRDEAFAYWDDPSVRGWQALDRVLAQGTVKASARWNSSDEEKLPTRIAPPAANIRRNIMRNRVPWYAVFEFRKDGRWYWVAFAECCD